MKLYQNVHRVYKGGQWITVSWSLEPQYKLVQKYQPNLQESHHSYDISIEIELGELPVQQIQSCLALMNWADMKKVCQEMGFNPYEVLFKLWETHPTHSVAGGD